MKRKQLKTGDIVRHTGKFLRSISWCLDVPINGLVKKVGQPLSVGGPDLVHVLWCDRDESAAILSCNVELDPRRPSQ